MADPVDIYASVKASRRAALIAASVFYQGAVDSQNEEEHFKTLVENFTNWIETGVWKL